MRTKHLLYTMALAGIFAACTQEEFETVNGADALAGRKSIGKITLTEAPSTRWVVNDWDEIAPEVGDGFSYLLVDDPLTGLAGQHDYPIDNYVLVNQIHTNYVFKYDGKNWGNDANLVEGNYLLVGPDQKVQNRKPVEITLPAEQNLALGEDGKVDPLSIIKEFNKSGYPIYIGHRFLSEGSDYNNVLPARYHIFAYPEITVKNSALAGATEVPRVVKVVLKSEDDTQPFIINAPLDNVKAARLLTNESFEAAGTDDKDQYVVGEWQGYMNEVLGVNEKELTVEQVSDKTQKENQQPIPADAAYEIKDRTTGVAWSTFKYNHGLGDNYTSDLLADQPRSVSKYIVINMPGEGVDLKAGESFKFNAVIPAETYDMNKNLIIYAVLSNGDVWRKVMASNNEYVHINPGKRYPQEDYNGMTVRDEKGLYFTIDVHAGSDGVSQYVKASPSELPGIGDADAVMTTEELIAALGENSSTTTKNITIGGKDVVYDQRAEDALANNNAQIVNILGHIKIEGGEDKTLNINSKVSFADAVINKGTVAFNSEEATLGTVLVGKDATFELKEAKEAKNIYNVGKLKLYTENFVKVYNYETLEVYTDVTAGSGVIKNGYDECGDQNEIISDPIKLTPSVDLKVVDLGNNSYDHGVYSIKGELNYPIVVERLNKDEAAELEIAENVTIEKDGKITNSGNITGTGTLTVARGLGETLTNNVNGKIECSVVIEGASHTLAQLTAPGVDAGYYKEAATVTNSGEMKEVTVDGKLVMKSGSRVETVNMTAGVNGEIDNTDKGVIETINNNDVTVFAEFTSLDLSTANARKAATDKIKGYTSSYNVEVIRLTGAMSLGNGNWAAGTEFNKVNTITEIEFAEGSSLNMGDGTFTTDFDISVSAPDIEWNGNRTTSSHFNLTGTASRKQYVDTENGKKVAKEGNVVFNNCDSDKQSSLE